MASYVADFETSKNENETWIWAWGQCEIGNVENFSYGNSMDEFMAWCKKGKVNKTVYFHNLRFDGEFIFIWLLNNGFRYSKKKEDMTFDCIISGDGHFYSIDVVYSKRKKAMKKVTFLDSNKKLPMSVKRIAKGFGLPMSKGDIDHDVMRLPDHVMTVEELDYLKRDCQIVAMALGIQMDKELDRMTIGSDAMAHFVMGLAGGDYKKGKKLFERYFPSLPLNIDNQLRVAYRGGFTYANPKFMGIDMGVGTVYDINSMYPWAMRYKDLPYGMPLPYKGEYEYDEQYPLYIAHFRCEFYLKEDHLPTIQIKGQKRYNGRTYQVSHVDVAGNSEPAELTLTSVDLELFFEHYRVENLEWLDGFMFKSCQGIFNKYIDYWMDVKVKSEESGNEALRSIAKLMLNNLYGKFGSNPDVTGRYPELQDDGSIKYIEGDEEFTKPVYTAMAAFITSWCRDNIIRSAQSVYDRFIYADTDSLHLIGEEVPPIEIHQTKLGAWKHESTFEYARFLRAKTYVEFIKGELKVTCSGMPDNIKEMVTWDNFRVMNTKEPMYYPCRDGYWFGKLTPHHITGGQILEAGPYTISA